MKVLTFQHKDILKDINTKGIYLCTKNSEYFINTPKSYQIVFDNIKLKDEGATKPIFGWCMVISPNNDELIVNNMTIGRCMGMTEQDENSYLLFELDIPKERLSLQEFYSFVAMRCEEEQDNPYYEKFEDFPYKSIFEIGENQEVQCTFTGIHKEDIKHIYSYKKDINIANKNNIIRNKMIMDYYDKGIKFNSEKFSELSIDCYIFNKIL